MQSILSFIFGFFEYISVGSRNRNFQVSFYLIFFANLFPVFGILIFDWPLFYLMILYWCESALVGMFNIGKILLIGIRPGIEESFLKTAIGTLGGVCVAVFFTAYYGIFLSIAFIVTMVAGPKQANETGEVSAFDSMGDTLREFFYIPSWDFSFWENLDNGLIVLILLFVSLFLEFYNVYFKEKEYLRFSYSEQIKYPFPRILALVFTVVFGGLIGGALSLLHPSLRNLGMVLGWIFIKFLVDMHFLALDYGIIESDE